MSLTPHRRTHTQTALASDLCSSECTVCLSGESGRVSWPPVATVIQRVLRVPRAERVVDQTEDMTACVDDTKCNIWFRALKYNQQVQSARSDRATGPPVRVLSSGWRKRRRRGYVWIIALSMPKFASRQDRPDTAVSSPTCSYTSRHGNTAPACDNRLCTHIAS